MMYVYNPDRSGLSEIKLLQLEPWRTFAQDRPLAAEMLRPPAALPCVTQQTPIASIGSCFAREIKFWLQRMGYNYLEFATGPCAAPGSARYNRVYNTFTLRQEFERAFEVFDPAEPVWDFIEDGTRRLLDPYRKGVAWDDRGEMERELAEHQRNVRRAFTEAQIIIITVGQAEVWFNTEDGSVFPLVPPAPVFDPKRHGFRLTTVQENIDNLRRVHELVSMHSPGAHIIMTLSPVPLRATFRQMSAISANSASKAILRAAIDAFVSENSDSTTYFPAYEVVMDIERDPFEDDNRHVKPEVIDRIMALFESWFVKTALPAAGRRGSLVPNA